MLRFRSGGALWDRRATPPRKLWDVGIDIRLEQMGEFQDGAGDWTHVRALFETPVEGHALAANLVPVDATRQPFDAWAFVKYCTLSARMANDHAGSNGPGVSRDYVLAVALVVNDVTAASQLAGLKALDPFRLTEADWSLFLERSGDDQGYLPGDQLDPLAQVDAEVSLASMGLVAVSDALTVPGAGSGPYVPNSIDLFLVRMLGIKPGVEALRELRAGNAASFRLDKLIAPELLATVRARYPTVLGGSETDTVSALAAQVERRFDAALKVAAELVGEHTPEDLPLVPQAGEPPWLTLARDERGIKEPAGRILEYFGMTTFKAKSTKDPWCAAFVTFCMAKCGNPVVVANCLARDNARAASWAKWGRPWPAGSQDIPLGAVVVLSPVEGSDRSGHVGFFLARDGDKVVLLGGNQSNEVREQRYPASRVAHVRWLDWTGRQDEEEDATKAGKPGGFGGFGPFTGADWSRFCEVLGRLESGNEYGRVNKFGYSGRWQFGAAALIDVGYVMPGRTRNFHLRDTGSWTGKNSVRSRADWLSNKAAQDEAILAYTAMHYRQLVRRGALGKASSLPRVAGLLAAAHLKGVGGATLLARGTSTTDGFGTSTMKYYATLSAAFGGSGVLQA